MPEVAVDTLSEAEVEDAARRLAIKLKSVIADAEHDRDHHGVSMTGEAFNIMVARRIIVEGF